MAKREITMHTPPMEMHGMRHEERNGRPNHCANETVHMHRPWPSQERSHLLPCTTDTCVDETRRERAWQSRRTHVERMRFPSPRTHRWNETHAWVSSRWTCGAPSRGTSLRVSHASIHVRLRAPSRAHHAIPPMSPTVSPSTRPSSFDARSCRPRTWSCRCRVQGHRSSLSSPKRVSSLSGVGGVWHWNQAKDETKTKATTRVRRRRDCTCVDRHATWRKTRGGAWDWKRRCVWYVDRSVGRKEGTDPTSTAWRTEP